MALEEIKCGRAKSVRAAAIAFEVPYTDLRDRMNGVTWKGDKRNNAMIFTLREENSIVKYIIDLDAKGYPAKYEDITPMAQIILGLKNTNPQTNVRKLGTKWPYRFVKRRPVIKAKLSRGLDYKRYMMENIPILEKWFDQEKDVVDRYGIQPGDIYNFDESGFMMGVVKGFYVIARADKQGKGRHGQWLVLTPLIIFKGEFVLEPWVNVLPKGKQWKTTATPNGWTNRDVTLLWLKHFDEQTKARRTGRFRLLVIDGHDSHQYLEFEKYFDDNDIIIRCLPPHSSHITQPLDLGVFSILKSEHGNQIKGLSRVGFKMIQKEDFIAAFVRIFDKVFSKTHIESAWKASGLIPWNASVVISRLDVRLVTPPLQQIRQEDWVSQTPRTSVESLLQIEHVRNSIRATQVFMSNQLNETLTANARLSARAKQKRKRVQKGIAGLVGEEDLERIRVEKEAAAYQKRVERRSGDTGQPGVRKESACGISPTPQYIESYSCIDNLMFICHGVGNLRLTCTCGRVYDGVIIFIKPAESKSSPSRGAGVNA
ncbi:hypothetical protein EV44_g3566 [Erysiphe necator]|uniref:HTH CENPB-type domain-containing protein n=1 Tax=Uncinula necator TaxID=52586 RepID=A0A0B1P7P8_UNCNE|nr:hypothetical protein EV44_g3566 [Erysiphe necator]